MKRAKSRAGLLELQSWLCLKCVTLDLFVTDSSLVKWEKQHYVPLRMVVRVTLKAWENVGRCYLAITLYNALSELTPRFRPSTRPTELPCQPWGPLTRSSGQNRVQWLCHRPGHARKNTELHPS